ncbi:MAG: DUF368 domain-containing protein [Bacteroidota bacterium]
MLFLKGLAMGGADVVPGVSGGTIALITGIYEELIQTINQVNFSTIRLLFKGEFNSFWKALNGNFLLVLIAGIVISFVSLAKVMTFLLENHPLLLWSFFFGLILASAWLIGKELKPFKLNYALAIIAGAFVSYWITTISPSSSSDNLIYLFFSGMLAFCAMILPGISGSFILLLLGAYSTVIGAVGNLTSNFKESVIIVGSAVLGGITGLLIFSRLLKWLFEKYRRMTIALMTGFLLGSLNKIWPWQKITNHMVKHEGTPDEELVIINFKNVLPSSYEKFELIDGKLVYLSADPQLGLAIALCLAGFLTIFLLERLGRKFS